MAKRVINAGTLVGCPDLHVIESMCKVNANDEGVVVVGGPHPEDAVGFEARRAAIRYAETKLGRKAGYNGEPVQKIAGTISHKTPDGKTVVLHCAKHGVTVTQ